MIWIVSNNHTYSNHTFYFVETDFGFDMDGYLLELEALYNEHIYKRSPLTVAGKTERVEWLTESFSGLVRCSLLDFQAIYDVEGELAYERGNTAKPLFIDLQQFYMA
jgi:hypothetical protein